MKERYLPILLSKENVNKRILARARKNKQIIYGARSIQHHIGLFSRPTSDWDIFSNNPKKDAYGAEKELDREIGFNYYYVKKGINKGTWKVKSKGYDLKQGTEDDEGIVDYTLTPRPKPKFKTFNGIRYRSLREEVKAKKKAIRDPNFKFRKEKDEEDIRRISFARWKL